MLHSKLSSEVFVATVRLFNGSTIRPAENDKNGLAPIILDVVAGSCPNKRVLAGTVAQTAGMIEGKTYMCKFEEIEANEFGRQFRFSAVMELGAIEVIESVKALGMPNLIEVVENEPEVTKSGKFSYPRGLTIEDKDKFNLMDADTQDKFLDKHPDYRSHHVEVAKL